MNAYFIKSMALFWVFAEMVILVLLLQGIAFVQGKEKSYRMLTGFLSLIFLLLYFMAFRGETLFSGILNFQDPIHPYFYKYALWHLFCTMWVVLEGSIMFYALEAYFVLKCALIPSTAMPRTLQGVNPWSRNGLVLLIGSSVLFYLFYEYQVFSITERHALEKQNLKNLYRFYIKICGFFWFFIEAAVAVIGLKTYSLLKKKDPLPHESH